MPTVRYALLLVPGLAGLPAAVRAQTPAERVVLDSMRTSIAAIADSSTLCNAFALLLEWNRRWFAE